MKLVRAFNAQINIHNSWGEKRDSWFQIATKCKDSRKNRQKTGAFRQHSGFCQLSTSIADVYRLNMLCGSLQTWVRQVLLLFPFLTLFFCLFIFPSIPFTLMSIILWIVISKLSQVIHISYTMNNTKTEVPKLTLTNKITHIL